MHSSLSFLVSGQAQHIFFFGFPSGVDLTTVDAWSSFDSGNAMADEEFTTGKPPMPQFLKECSLKKKGRKS